jgi:UDP-N-acetylmuramate dehydrogenase
MLREIARDLAGRLKGTVDASVPLKSLNTFGIGGNAALLVRPHDEEDIFNTLLLARDSETPLYLLGGGSNIIVPDEGINGIVLHLAQSFAHVSLSAGTIVAQAGLTDEGLAEFALAQELTGFEWIFDIPGSVGGAVFMNAGNNDGEMADSIKSVRWMDGTGEIHCTQVEGLQLDYRSSMFQSEPGIILEVILTAPGQSDPAAIQKKMVDIRALRQSRFPPETLCAGSIFKRPPGHYAGRLIEEAGCGGMQVGNALVSDKHKGFIVNIGGATATDVVELIEKVKKRVYSNSGIRLSTEVEKFSPLWTFRNVLPISL